MYKDFKYGNFAFNIQWFNVPSLTHKRKEIYKIEAGYINQSHITLKSN